MKVKNLLLLIFAFLWVVSCGGGKGVTFSSLQNSGDDGGASIPVVSDKPKPPQVNITQYPRDHALGKGTRVGFEVILGDNPISTLNCYLDGTERDCGDDTGQLVFENLKEGKHTFKVEVKDTGGLGADNQASWIIHADGKDYQKRELQIQVENHDNQVDVLFVVDNSESMVDEQQGIAGRIMNLFSKISPLNWRLGIITTDPYKFDPETNRYNPLADGVLLRFPDGSYQLNSGLDIDRAKDLFSRTIYRPETGNGHERGIRNTYRAIERATATGSVNDEVNRRLRNFFRPEASLIVVLISDEDETLVDKKGNPLPDQEKSNGANLVSLVKSHWPEKAFQFNSVIVQPDDKSNCSDENTKVGHAYFELSEDTGGSVEDICAGDYGHALDNIGTGVVKLKKSYLLDCEPMDINGDGQIDLNVVGSNGQSLSGYQLDGQIIQFDQFLRIGDYDINYFCAADSP